MFLLPCLTLLLAQATPAPPAQAAATQVAKEQPTQPGAASPKGDAPVAEPAQAPPPVSKEEPAPAAPEAPKADPGVRLFSLEAKRQDAEGVIMEFARAAGANIILLDKPNTLISLVIKDSPFEKAFAEIIQASEMTFRKVDKDYVVGSPLDMKIRYPEADEKTLDATYRCRRIEANSLVKSLRGLFPSELNMSIGPLFLTPILEGGGGFGGDGGAKPMAGTAEVYKTHDVVFSGPADLVRRALVLSRKFDRPRKQARIIVKIVEVNSTATTNLGIDWVDSLPLTAVEQIKGATTPLAPRDVAGAVVDGIRVGKFAHTPIVLNATLNALETKGIVKTLANPTILLLDGERSYIQAGDKYFYPVFKEKDQSGQSIYGVEQARIGIYLQVGIQIGLDNDMTLSLFPQVTFSNGKNVVNGAEYPNIGTREAQTTVKAVHGDTVVLGGIFQDGKSETRNGVPLLSRIPVLGKLFGTTLNTTIKSELMLFVTPEIVEDTAPAPNIKITSTERTGAPPLS